ncbi:MAG: hypothetical protein HY903_10285 [Deltaproteobacteria bacterium]|nr:hypothetical protein [Deltaproteobacteria bacterium]
MPGPEQILAGLTAIANRALPLAVLWHVLVACAVVGIAAGWRPSRRLSSILLTLPLLSVAAVAWFFGNPFNGTAFSVFWVALVVLGLRLPSDGLARAPAWSVLVGIGMVCFGLVYPHFLQSASPLTCLYAAPTGLVPCPTLSLVIGLALVADGLGSRTWSVVLACAGLFYGLFGTLRLGVYLDLGLIVGAAALLVRGILLPAKASVGGPAAA